MSTFVLVHGAWHGAWCWDDVATRLRTAGHRVITPTLSGLGARAGELAATIGLRTHADEIAAQLDQLPDPNLHVVGHSYAGLVVREAVDRSHAIPARLVLIDGWAGEDGDSLLTLAPDWFAAGIRSLVDESDGWRVSPPAPALVGVDDPETARWLAARLTAQPLRTFTEPTQLTGKVDAIPGTAILCRRSGGLPFADFAQRLGYSLEMIDTGHDAMLIDPEQLTNLIQEITGS